MDLVIRNHRYYMIHESQSLSPIKSPPILFNHHPHTSFPIVAVVIIGILAAVFLLVFYYIFVIKCCLNWHRIDILRRFSISRNRTGREDPLMAYNSPAIEYRGLDETVIRSIPIFRFQKDDSGERNFCECAVCLNEFQEDEKLRIIPNCAHVFHIDCIDVWLQNNPNCPLCRTSISISSTNHFLRSNQQLQVSDDPTSPPHVNFSGRDEDYVVIELGNGEATNIGDLHSWLGAQQRANYGEDPVLSPSPRKILGKKGKKLTHVSSMGDECINIREKDDQFPIQPIRRSFSMDSASDLLHLAAQEIIQQKNMHLNVNVSEVISSEGCSSRVRRNLFSFGHGRGSRSAVLPVHFESS